MPVDHLMFKTRSYYAYADWEKKTWDALTDLDISNSKNQDLHGVARSNYVTPADEKSNRYWHYWLAEIPEENRAMLNVYRIIPYTRILGIDELGDFYNEGIHLLVEYRDDREDPFEQQAWAYVESARPYDSRIFEVAADEKSRIKFFPKEIPDIQQPDLPPLDSK